MNLFSSCLLIIINAFVQDLGYVVESSFFLLMYSLYTYQIVQGLRFVVTLNFSFVFVEGFCNESKALIGFKYKLLFSIRAPCFANIASSF